MGTERSDGATKSYSEGLLRSFNEMYGPRAAWRCDTSTSTGRARTFGLYTEVMNRWMERLFAGQPFLSSETGDRRWTSCLSRTSPIYALRGPRSATPCWTSHGTETSLTELATMLGRVMGGDLPPEYGPARNATTVWRRLADTAKRSG